MSSDESEDDENRSYDVFIDCLPPTEARPGRVHRGDVYVELAERSTSHAIYISTNNNQWASWNPRDLVVVEVLGIPLYATPCGTQGLQYVTSEEEAHGVPAHVPREVSILAELIARDCGYTQFPKGPRASTKRSIVEVVTSPPRRTRARVPPKAEAVIMEGKGKGKTLANKEDIHSAPAEHHRTVHEPYPAINEPSKLDMEAATVLDPMAMQCDEMVVWPSGLDRNEDGYTNSGDEDAADYKSMCAEPHQGRSNADCNPCTHDRLL